MLLPDLKEPSMPYVKQDGYCISTTSYQREGFARYDNLRYLNASKIPYIVIPGCIRERCKGVLLGCRARVTCLNDRRHIEGVTGDFSGYNIGEAADAICKFFNPELSPRSGDDRRIYLFEFFPDSVPLFDDPVTDKPFVLMPA